MPIILKIRKELLDQHSITYLRKTEEKIEQKSDDHDAKRKNNNCRKRGRKTKEEIHRRSKVRKNTLKFNRYIRDRQIELEDETASTSLHQFHRESSAPPELPSSDSIKRKNLYVSKLRPRRSRTFSTVSHHLKETMHNKPVLQMLMQKFDFERAVKIIRLRKEFHEQQRLQRLQKALSKKSQIVENLMEVLKPERFTIKILNPVNY